MTTLFNKIKDIASDSTVKTVAGTLAVGGFLLNAVFGFGQTAFGLALQGLTAAAVLGMTTVNAAKKQQQSQSNDQEVPQCDQPDNFYNYQQDQPKEKPSILAQSLISSFFPVATSCSTTPQIREEKIEEEKGSTLVQKSITYFFNKVQKTATSCGIASTPKRRRRNADDDMMDMAYGTGTRAGWTPWAKR